MHASLQDKRAEQGRLSKPADETASPVSGPPTPDEPKAEARIASADVAADAATVVATLAQAHNRVAGLAMRLGHSHSSMAALLEGQPSSMTAKLPEMQARANCHFNFHLQVNFIVLLAQSTSQC